MLKTVIENNLKNPPIQQNNQASLARNNPSPTALALTKPTLFSCVWSFQNNRTKPTQHLSMHQALIYYTARFGTLQPDESVRLITPPDGNWQDLVSRDSLFSESRHQLIPTILEKAIAAKTVFWPHSCIQYNKQWYKALMTTKKCGQQSQITSI